MAPSAWRAAPWRSMAARLSGITRQATGCRATSKQQPKKRQADGVPHSGKVVKSAKIEDVKYPRPRGAPRKGKWDENIGKWA